MNDGDAERIDSLITCMKLELQELNELGET